MTRLALLAALLTAGCIHQSVEVRVDSPVTELSEAGQDFRAALAQVCASDALPGPACDRLRHDLASAEGGDRGAGSRLLEAVERLDHPLRSVLVAAARRLAGR